MSNQKRRVIYMTDQEWADIASRSEKEGVSASAYIRAAIRVSGGVTFVRATERETLAPISMPTWNPAPKPSARGKK